MFGYNTTVATENKVTFHAGNLITANSAPYGVPSNNIKNASAYSAGALFLFINFCNSIAVFSRMSLSLDLPLL